MLEPWNDAKLLPPPVHTSKCNSNVDISDLNYNIKAIIRVLAKQSPIHKESAILSRFVYKFDKKFRNDIGYRNLKKTNTALRRYLALDLLKDVESFLSALPTNYEDVYLPTKQMLEYILVRLIAFSKIVIRICVCSKQGAVFYLDRVKRGESHWMSLMPYALLSRIWSLSKALIQYSCQWYTGLVPWLNKLQAKGIKFLPDNYELPTNIEKWLDVKNLDCFGRLEWTQKKHIEVDPSLLDSEEMSTFDTILDLVNQINEVDKIPDEEILLPLPVETKSFNQPITPLKTSDIGVAISRSSFHSMYNRNVSAEKLIKDSKYNHVASNVTNKHSLQQFLKKEEEFRNKSDEKSLTSHLSFMQWQALKTSLHKLHDSLANNRKIERKFQKLWNEKCLSYC